VGVMKYRVDNHAYADFDQAADAALTESLSRHDSVDIDMLDDEEVKLCSIAVSVHDVHPVEQSNSTYRAPAPSLN
jgi:hypothetical protein